MNIMQKKTVRMITFTDTYPIQGYGLCHSLPLFLKLEFLKISDSYKTQISNFIYDCLNGYAPFQFISWFNLNTTIHDHHTTTIHDHHTRSNVQLQTNNVINTTQSTTTIHGHQFTTSYNNNSRSYKVKCTTPNK